MEANQLQDVIGKGFNDLRAELDEKFKGLRAELDGKFEKIDGQFAELRRDVNKAGDEAHLAHVAIENLRHDFSIFDEGDSAPLARRVSALEVRVTRLERKRTQKKER